MQALRAELPRVRRFLLTQVSSAIGAHVGPGAVGVTVSPVRSGSELRSAFGR